MKQLKKNFIGVKMSDLELELLEDYQVMIGEENKSEAIRKLVRGTKAEA